ncbi:MAG: chemotaxis protein CheW [Nitrospira sp.]|nr:chemotaxis protein CheW [bacterium]MBL7049544.1 chemotaxis protein CheW [Nitrospira sp.]
MEDSGIGKKIDWEEVHTRIKIAEQALLHAHEPEQDEINRVLYERALRLAIDDRADDSAAVMIELIEFTLSYEKYALESRYVREIVSLQDITPLPLVPSYVLGIINLRGQILSVLDIRKLMSLPEKGLTDINRVIVLQDGEIEFGLLADRIQGIRHVDADRVRHSITGLTAETERYLLGIDESRTIIIDAGKMLNDKSIIVNQVIE